MNRTKAFKITYILILISLIAGFIYIQAKYKLPFHTLIIVSLFLLIPGRIEGYFYKNFYTGIRCLNKKNLNESEKYFKTFLNDLKKKPWIKKLIWFSYGIYTRDVEAVTYNNLGSILFEADKFDEAEKKFKKAISLDKKYSKPFYNMALLELLKNNKHNSKKYYQESIKLGLKNNTYEQIVSKCQKISTQLKNL